MHRGVKTTVCSSHVVGVPDAAFFVFKKVFFKATCPRRAHNFAVSGRIHSGLARNESHVFWHQQVYFEKFLTAAVCRPRRFEGRSVVLYVNETCIEVLKLQSAAVMWSGFQTQHFLFLKKFFLKQPVLAAFITLPSHDVSTRDLLEMKATSSGINKFVSKSF